MSFLWGKKAHHPKPAELVSLTLEAWARVRAQDNSTHSSAQESGGRASFSGSSDNAASSRPRPSGENMPAALGAALAALAAAAVAHCAACNEI